MPVDIELKKCSDRELRFYVRDPDKHSLPNLIAKLAIRKKGVVYAAYIIDHPLVSDPEVVILTDGTRHPIEVLEEVLSEARELANRFLTEFEAAMREHEAREKNPGSS
ncbi:MAG: DNA-directed RNA polymerase subunit L [Crenarchaeota archaeon]|nr:DNA-directed RNA polymerase subunit L [Thermoproteota archaeon]